MLGTTIVAGIPSIFPAYAMPWPWFPVDSVIAPARRSSAVRRQRLYSAPRALNDRMGEQFSYFTYTSQPERRLKPWEKWRGVGRRYRFTRARASRRSTMVGMPSIRPPPPLEASAAPRALIDDLPHIISISDSRPAARPPAAGPAGLMTRRNRVSYRPHSAMALPAATACSS